MIRVSTVSFLTPTHLVPQSPTVRLCITLSEQNVLTVHLLISVNPTIPPVLLSKVFGLDVIPRSLFITRDIWLL